MGIAQALTRRAETQVTSAARSGLERLGARVAAEGGIPLELVLPDGARTSNWMRAGNPKPTRAPSGSTTSRAMPPAAATRAARRSRPERAALVTCVSALRVSACAMPIVRPSRSCSKKI